MCNFNKVEHVQAHFGGGGRCQYGLIPRAIPGIGFKGRGIVYVGQLSKCQLNVNFEAILVHKVNFQGL
jgi:hypothetical protein